MTESLPSIIWASKLFTQFCYLLTENYFNYMVFAALALMDPERELFTCLSCGIIYHADDLEMYQDTTYKQWFSCGRILKPLNFSEEELGLIKAVVILNPCKFNVFEFTLFQCRPKLVTFVFCCIICIRSTWK